MVILSSRTCQQIFLHRSYTYGSSIFLSCFKSKRCCHSWWMVDHGQFSFSSSTRFPYIPSLSSLLNIGIRWKANIAQATAVPDADEFKKLPPKCPACGAIFQHKKYNLQNGAETELNSSSRKGSWDKRICLNCQRIHTSPGNHGSVVLDKIDSHDAIKQLRHVRRRPALILYIVDLLNLEGTVLSNILQLVGKKKRIIIVGNKVDKIPRDSQRPVEQLELMKDVVKDVAFRNGLEDCKNFRDICLISSKTGFGLKTLVEKINKKRSDYQDIYLIGCVNTGKSTLYNLIVNLLNVHKPKKLPAQATEYHIPGTTAGLIRQKISSSELKKLMIRLDEGPPWEGDESFELKEDETESKEQRACFIYDTPGITNNDQVVKYLTPLSNTEKVWQPRIFFLKPGFSLFFDDLARLDCIGIVKSVENVGCERLHKLCGDIVSQEGIYVTAMVPRNIPIYFSSTETLDKELPIESPERSSKFPKFCKNKYTIYGKDQNINACDLVLHNIGWLSVAAENNSKVCISLHTPNGEDQVLRSNPMLPYTVQRELDNGLPHIIMEEHYDRHEAIQKPWKPFVWIFQLQNETVYSWISKIKLKMRRQGFQTLVDKRKDKDKVKFSS